MYLYARQSFGEHQLVIIEKTAKMAKDAGIPLGLSDVRSIRGDISGMPERTDTVTIPCKDGHRMQYEWQYTSEKFLHFTSKRLE